MTLHRLTAAPVLLVLAGPAGRLRVEDGGSGGVPVVLLHSLAGNRSQWAHQLEHLRPFRRAIAVDLSGHGESDPARDGDYSLEAGARDVAAVVDSLGIPRFVLVGHSRSGGIIAAYAGLHPERVAGLLFVDPIGDMRQIPAPDWAAYLARFTSDQYASHIEASWNGILTGADSAVRVLVLQALHATPKDVVVGSFEGMRSLDPAAALARYSGPMLSIITPANEVPFAMHRVVPGLQVRRVTGTSHWLQMDRPSDFNQRLDAFLAEVDRARPGA